MRSRDIRSFKCSAFDCQHVWWPFKVAKINLKLYIFFLINFSFFRLETLLHQIQKFFDFKYQVHTTNLSNSPFTFSNVFLFIFKKIAFKEESFKINQKSKIAFHLKQFVCERANKVNIHQSNHNHFFYFTVENEYLCFLNAI